MEKPFKWHKLPKLSSELFSCSVVSNSLWPDGLQHARLPCPSLCPGVCLNPCPLSRWCHPTISPTVTPFLLPSVFPSIRVLSNEMALCIRCPKYWASASASVLPMNIQGWFPLGLTGLIFLQSKGLSRVFSNTTFKSINSLALSLHYSPTLISIPDYWKNHSFDYMDLLCFLICCLGLSFLPRSKHFLKSVCLLINNK